MPLANDFFKQLFRNWELKISESDGIRWKLRSRQSTLPMSGRTVKQNEKNGKCETHRLQNPTAPKSAQWVKILRTVRFFPTKTEKNFRVAFFPSSLCLAYRKIKDTHTLTYALKCGNGHEKENENGGGNIFLINTKQNTELFNGKIIISTSCTRSNQRTVYCREWKTGWTV